MTSSTSVGACNKELLAVAPVTSPSSKEGPGFDASTRASSPGGASSSSSDGTSHGSPALLGTLAQRRGLRTAILDDLGVDFCTNAMEGVSASPSLYTGTQLSCGPLNSLPPRSTGAYPSPCPPFPSSDASQRSCVQMLGHPSPNGASASWSPPSRVSLVGGSLGSVPLRVQRGGDASDRSPNGYWAASCGHSPAAHQAGVPMWGGAAASVAATRAAAAVYGSSPMQTQTMACGWPLGAAGGQQPSWGVSPQASTQVSPQSSASLNQGEAMRRWLLGVNEGPSLSNEELAERMRAAEPETYDD